MEDEALGISAPRLSALSVLVFAGPKRIGELARLEQVEPPTMTRLVDGLVRDGLVAREPDPDDATGSGSARPRRASGARKRAVGMGRRVLAAGGDRSRPTSFRALATGVDVLQRAVAGAPTCRQ